MSEAKRRSAASRPGKAGDGSGRQRKRPVGQRREAQRHDRSAEAKAEPVGAETGDTTGTSGGTSISESIAAAVEYQSDQRLGSAARRAAILAALVCVLTLTIAGPVRTYFAQRTEMKQLAASEAALRQQIAELEQQKEKLADPGFIAAQARERLGFVMPGDVPYQVQLPPGATTGASDPGAAAPWSASSSDPWYTSLWQTIADTPHNVPTSPAPPPPVPPPPPGPPPGG